MPTLSHARTHAPPVAGVLQVVLLDVGPEELCQVRPRHARLPHELRQLLAELVRLCERVATALAGALPLRPSVSREWGEMLPCPRQAVVQACIHVRRWAGQAASGRTACGHGVHRALQGVHRTPPPCSSWQPSSSALARHHLTRHPRRTRRKGLQLQGTGRHAHVGGTLKRHPSSILAMQARARSAAPPRAAPSHVLQCLLSCLFMLNMSMGGVKMVFILSSQMILRLFLGSCGQPRRAALVCVRTRHSSQARAAQGHVQAEALISGALRRAPPNAARPASRLPARAAPPGPRPPAGCWP